MSTHPRVSRLRWRCRRGMKELDVLLERFLEGQAARLSAGGWPEFEALLDTEDDRLWAWLQNPAASGAGPFRSLLENIRSGTR